MKKYQLTIIHNEWPVSQIYSIAASSKEEAITAWHLKHPSTSVTSIKEVSSDEPSEQQTPTRTPLQQRTHHKARITQMRNNAISLIEAEDSILTPEERVQLSRATCQLDRILALWATRTMDLKLSDFK